MKGIETKYTKVVADIVGGRSDHCPAMKGIETLHEIAEALNQRLRKRPLPRNEGD